MRKLFLLIPALFIAMMMNAKVTTIGPDDPTATVDNTLISALSSASDDDVIILKSGFYNESSDYLVFDKNVEVRAADGATPVIQLTTYIKVQGGKHPIISGLTFDGSAQGSRDQYFRFTDSNDNELELNNCTFNDVKKNIFRCESGKKFASLEVNNCKFINSLSNVMKLESSTCGSAHFDGCEFSGTADIVINGIAGSHLDECVVNDCYFHNNAKQSIYFAASETEGIQTCDALTVTNSTFANTTALTNWISVIDVRPYGSSMTDAIKVVIDHCTFYNNPTVDSGHADIRLYKLSDATISNCIFAHPEAYERRATYNYGGTISNCLTYNLTYDANRNAHRQDGGLPVLTNNFTANPLFTDAANADYSFPGNWTTMSISPARGAATDGSDLGDPRWYSAEVLPNVDFATPYQFVGAKALLAGKIWYDDVNEYLYGDGGSNKDYGTATWKFHATKGGVFSIAANINSGNTSTHKLRVEVLDADGNSVGEFAEQTSTLPGTLVLPAVGDYKIILHDDQTWSSVKIDNITISYIGGAVQAMPGTTNINEAWFSSNGTRTPGEKIVIPSGHQHEGWVKWNVNFANAANYKAKVNINCDNGHNYTVALYEDEDDLTPITWGEGEQTEDASPLDLGAKEVPAGNYILKVTNAVQYSHAELVSVQFVNAGGGLVNIPGDITLTEAILSSRAYIDENGEIRFTSDAEHGHVTEESVAWRVNVSKAGYYKFTTSVNSNNGHSYLVSVYNADETVLKGSVPQSGDDIWGAPKTFSTDNIYLEEGEYRVKVQNTTNNSNGRIVSISASYEGGAVVNIPNVAIPLVDAIVSSGTTRSESEINFHGDVNEYATWNIQAEEGLYTFTINITGTNHSKMELTVTDSEDNELYKKDLGVSGSGAAVHSGIFMPNGAYVIKVANVNPSADGCVNSISAALADNALILDEMANDNSAINAAHGQSKQIVLKRSFKGNMYNTICVPFTESSNTQLTNIFGEGYELLVMSSATLDGNELTLNFDADDQLRHGRPYLIKPTKDVKNPVFAAHTIDKSTGYNTKECTSADFIGSFIAGEVPAGDQNLFLGPNDLLYFSQNATPIKGMRAYFHVKVPGAAQAIKHARIVKGTQVITELNLVDDDNKAVKMIENGQLIITIDGVRYNVMGTKIQ